MPHEPGHIFLSYSHKDDARWLEEIKTALKPILRDKPLKLWDDTQGIAPGTLWRSEIDSALASAKAAIFLVSQNFLASDFIHNNELPILLDAAEKHKVLILWIAVSASTVELTAPRLASYRPLNSDPTKPLDQFDGPWRNKELVTIVKKIAVALEEHRPPPPPRNARAAELAYLKQLVDKIEQQAAIFSPLAAQAQTVTATAATTGHWRGNPAFELLTHLRRAEFESKRDIPNIIDAFTPDPITKDKINKAVLLGAPGAGKSTTLHRLALDLATTAQNDPAAPLPLLVPLGSWTHETQTHETQPFTDFLAAHLPHLDTAKLRLQNRAVLLLDGLNEMPTATRAAKAIQIRDLPDPAIVVTCRLEDYTGSLDLNWDDRLILAPLTNQGIWNALQKYGAPEAMFWELSGDRTLNAVHAKWLASNLDNEVFWSPSTSEELKQSIRAEIGWDEHWRWQRRLQEPAPRSLLTLASNPFMLSMLYWVWSAKGELPQNRGDLFRTFILVLLAREGLTEGDPKRPVPTAEGQQLITGLTNLAWTMQHDRISRGKDDSGDFGVLTVVPEAAFPDSALLAKAQACTLIDGTLSPKARTAEIHFRHQLLQEYFTAQALLTRVPAMSPYEMLPKDNWWERSGWEEALVLLAGFHPDGECTKVVDWLADAQPEVAVRCLFESGAESFSKPALYESLKSRWMPRLLKDAAPEARAAVGRALGRLNLDDRPGVGLLHNGLLDIDWVEIPAGNFIYQDGRKPQTNKRFRIARYPVTNAQFRAFLDAPDGFTNDRWWQGLDNPNRTPPGRTPPDHGWTEPNHPVDSVNWFDAMAFCTWLTHKVGFAVRLPTEQEWERTARGVDGREYPWGDGYQAGRANINETYASGGRHNLGRTSPVGIYSSGASPEGALDLSGNVWEWCLNEYAEPQRTQHSGSESRVLRGGRWVLGPRYARADYRDCGLPRARGFSIGFRVVSVSPIPR